MEKKDIGDSANC